MAATHQKRFIFNLAHIKSQFLNVPSHSFLSCANLSFVFSAIFCHSHNETSFSKPEATPRDVKIGFPLSQSGTVEENFFFFSPSCQLSLLWLPLLSTFCPVAPNQMGLEGAMEANMHVTHMFTDISSVCDVRCWRLRSK